MSYFQFYFNNNVCADMLDLTLRWIYAYFQQNLLHWLMYLGNGNVINGNNMSFPAQLLVNIIQLAQSVNRSQKDGRLSYLLIVANLHSLV